MKNLVIALVGNPNAGKTTVFNGLTGSRQHVGNYPGVTVEMKEGRAKSSGKILLVRDLPGTYSLTPYSEEEKVAREVLWKTPPDTVINVVDAANLERNLYLTLQLKEMGVPVVVALNMIDIAKEHGQDIDTTKLSKLLEIPVVETVGHRGQGLPRLLEVAAGSHGSNHPDTTHFSPEINAILDEIVTQPGLKDFPGERRWLALKLLEDDPEIVLLAEDSPLIGHVRTIREQFEKQFGKSPGTILANQRYDYIGEVCRRSVKSSLKMGQSLTERIDRVVLNRFLGLPIFLILMYLVFHLTFTLADPLMGWIEEFFGYLGETVTGFWSEGSESLLKSLIVDGIIGGVGGVLVFLPNILLLFLAIALLEDSGYMARAAFIMDRIMNRIGLHGKSFIPMLIGFGCSVPAIMATRTMDNRRDRLVTMLVVPLMSCGARLPIYALIIPAFFAPVWQAPVLWSIYIVGVLLAIMSAKVLRSTLFRGESVPFIMELPPYHRPTIGGMLQHMWERGKLYIQKAGTLILGISVLLWVLSTFPKLPDQRTGHYSTMRTAAETTISVPDSLEIVLAGIDNLEAEERVAHSYAGRLGKAVEPVIRPLGFDWRIGTALVGAFAAKEVFVASMGVVYSVGEADEESESLRNVMKERYTPLIAYCIMLFSLISAPCMATIAITKRESNSYGWALFQLVGLTVLAWLLTMLVYQIGSAAGL